jgi:hypothetical protein
MRLLRILVVLGSFVLPAAALNREAFTMTKYDLNVELEPEQHRLGARGKLTLRNDSNEAQKVAALQISSSLDWRSIKVDGKPLQFVSQPFTSDVDHTGALSEAIVTLPAELKPKETVEVEIAYEGTIVLDTTRLTRVGVLEAVAKKASWDQIGPSFTAVRGVGHVAWYPIATESADFSEGNSMFQVVERWKKREAQASMDVNLCISGSTRSIALMGDSINGAPGSSMGGTPSIARSCQEHHFDQLGVTVPAFTGGDLHRKAPTENSPLNIYFLAGNESGAYTYAASFDNAVQFLRDWFGVPQIPVRISDLSSPNTAPFESGNMLLAPMAGEDAKLAGINVVHMLTHSAIQSPRPWVHEGLAHFAEAAYREKQGGREAALMLLGIHRAAFLENEKESASHPQGSTEDALATTFEESYYRSKAAYVWWMLRDMAGDSALKQAIRAYKPEEDKDPKYVETLVEGASKKDLSWFFDDWVYHDRGLPDFHVQSVHPWKNEKGTNMLTVTIENLGTAGAEVPFTVHFGDGEVANRLQVRAKSTATMRVEVPGVPTEIVINDGSVPESDVTNNVFKLEQQ